MKLHTTCHAACLVLVCTIILQVHSAPLEDSTWQQPGAADSVTPLTVKPLGTSIVPQDYTNQPNWDTRVRRTTTNDRDTESDSSQVSGEVDKRSADDDSPNGNEETGDDNNDDGDTTDTTDTSQEQDDASTEDSLDDPTDKRRRRSADVEQRQKRQVREDSYEDDGGLTREAAVVSPVRRRRSPEHKEDTDVSTNKPENYDESTPDKIEDAENTESSTETKSRRQGTKASTVGALDGSPVIVVAPSGIPVKAIPQALNHTLQQLQKQINNFEAVATGDQSTMPTVGVLAGASTKQDKDTIIHTISSAQYIVH